ncbi:MAG: hypothetical protein ABS68_12350 [Niastella sp. SCN 39-18]|nr:hypothetical protein [Sphingobacteriales bacterium]ODT51588.1 MAG: hypothetical protein ABS68_12350 [Niastella sp. SCN 39-18]OJW08259.1 MAG: hypothetical protein BGO53_05340 [Sphingobacteriales bacterium 39-19]
MKLKALIAVISFTLLVSFSYAQSNIQSQEYKTALGVKFYPGAVSLKHFVKPTAAVEGLGYFWNHGMRITGLYEFHHNINDVNGLKWYVGPGAHVGFYNNKYYDGGTFIGIDGVIGLDYKFKGAPINLSLDWQPSFEFGDGAGFSGNWGGLAIRYVF